MKKMKYEGKRIGETEYYFIHELDESKYNDMIEDNMKVYALYNKLDDSVITCTEFEIAGPAVVYRDVKNYKDYAIYSNWDKMQRFGGRYQFANAMIIDSWKKEMIDGKETIVFKYTDTNGRKYIRCLDENGDIYKKTKTKKIIEEKQEDILTI